MSTTNEKLKVIFELSTKLRLAVADARAGDSDLFYGNWEGQRFTATLDRLEKWALANMKPSQQDTKPDTDKELEKILDELERGGDQQGNVDLLYGALIALEWVKGLRADSPTMYLKSRKGSESKPPTSGNS
jgi:hypothetical protein